MPFLRRGLKVACMHPQEIHRRRFKFFPWQGLYSPTRLQGNVEVIYGSGNLSRMQSVPPVHYLGGKLCQLQDSRERILPVLPSPIARPRLLGGSPQEGQVRLRAPARVCRSLPAISIALSIRIPAAGKNEKLRSSHFSGGGNDSTKLARHF